MIRIVVACFALAFLRAPAFAEPPSINDFVTGSSFWSPALSPSGDYVATVRIQNGHHYVRVDSLGGGGDAPMTMDMGDVYVNWIEWANDDRLLIGTRLIYDRVTGDPVPLSGIRLWRAQHERYALITFDRLTAINRDGSDPVTMFSNERRFRENRSNSRVISMLPEDPAHIIMPTKQNGDLDLFKVNVYTGDAEKIASGNSETFAWYVDRNGDPAFRYSVNWRGTLLKIHARETRPNGSSRWRHVETIRLNRDDENRTQAEIFRPVSPGANATEYLVLARPEGENETSLWRYDFSSDTFLEKLAGIEGVDVDTAIMSRGTYELLGISYVHHRRELVFLVPELQDHMSALMVHFGDETSVIPTDSNRDGNRWILRTLGPTDPGTYHVYDVDQTSVDTLGVSRSGLRDKTFGETQVVTYQARDGLELSGYLTRPVSAARDGVQPPLIMMPHGGPEYRDMLIFDDQVQVLAAYGYQVFQPNFRGSSGFGKAFADAGRRQWGKAMQTDVEDGFAYLVSEGLADPDRACIYGESYGGYVAMAAATLTPDLYQCAISVAGVSDLIEVLERERQEEGRNSEAFEYWTKHIGDLSDDSEELARYSPARRAENVQIPILLMHGEDDTVVFPEQSELMRDALERAGKTVEYLAFLDTGHSGWKSADWRRKMNRVVEFLHVHLPAYPEPPEANGEEQITSVSDVLDMEDMIDIELESGAELDEADALEELEETQ